jgi:hypothetical protein
MMGFGVFERPARSWASKGEAMKNLFRSALAIAAFAALLVVPSIASASPELTSPTGTKAAIGTKFLATNVAHAATTKAFTTTTAAGNMTCQNATVTGEVVKNDGTQLVGTISTFELSGSSGEPCASPFGPATITPNHTSNPTHNGIGSLPWCMTFGAKDEFTIFGEAGGSCTSGQTRPVTIVYHFGGAGGSFSCTYQRAAIKGTYTTHPADAILTIAQQEFSLITSSAIFCPSSFSIDMALTLATDVNHVSGTALYID